MIIKQKQALLAYLGYYNGPLDGMYYELTYNGNKKELYFDAYKKQENKAIPVG